MAQQTLNNGELGDNWRVKVNANFTELYTYSIRTNVSGQINAVTEKLTFADNDVFLIEDSAASYAKKRLKKSNLGIDTTAIQDAAGTTGLFTEETADTLVGHSANTGTNLIFEMFEGTGTPVSVFQIDGNGNLFNDGEIILKYSTVATTRSIYLGTNIGPAAETAQDSVFIGNNSGRFSQVAHNSVCIGFQAGLNLLSINNVMIGSQSGRVSQSATENTFLGSLTAYSNTTGDGNVYLGYHAGYYQVTTSNKLLIDNQDRSTLAAELTDSLIVGDFHATPASQTIQFNAVTTIRNGTTGDLFVINDASTDVFTVDNAGNSEQDGYEKSTGSIKAIRNYQSGTTALDADNYHSMLDANSFTVTLTLPAISAVIDGTVYTFTCTDSSNVCTLQVTGGDYIGYTGTVSSVLFSAGQQKTYQAYNSGKRWIEFIA